MSGVLNVLLAGGTTAAAWTPASLTGLIGWWKADTGVTTSSGNVTAVADQSGLGHNLANSGTVPFNATGFNGHPAFDFAAANNAALAVSPFAIGTGNKGSVFVVGQMKTDTASFGGAVVYGFNGFNDYDQDGGAALLTRTNTSNSIETYRHGIFIDAAISLSTSVVVGVVYDGTNQTLYVNGSSAATGLINFNWVSGGTFVIGNRFTAGSVGGGGAWDGPIAEVIITNADNTADVAAIYAYAQSKYGI